jgi:heterodisulfide reductase subunit A-like polyferredoxin
MAQLDKIFSTHDCSIRILAPKMADCNEHPDINVITCAEVRVVRELLLIGCPQHSLGSLALSSS